MSGVEPQSGERLDSWKAISSYLGRDEGTLRRWERTRGLPIRRVPGRKGASVYAFTSEIDAWLKEDPPETGSADVEQAEAVQPEAPEVPSYPARFGWIAVAMAIALIVIGWAWADQDVSPSDLHFDVTDATVTARDAAGRSLWVHALGEEFRHIASQSAEHSRVVGGANPAIYVATAIRFRRTDNFVADGRLASFDLDGRRRWLFEFQDTLTIGGKPFGAPWGVTAFALDESTGARRIAVAAHHYTWGASLVTILDDEGRRRGTYANDGWLEQVQWLGPSRLAIGGFRESMNGGLVVLVDPNAMDAQSPESDPAHQCSNCGAGQPLRMAVFPRSEINLVTGSRFNRAVLEHAGDRLRVRTVEVPAGDHAPAEAIYEFTEDLDLLRTSFSERYWEVHDRLERDGKLDHGRASCPAKNGPPEIHAWARDTGWTVTRR